MSRDDASSDMRFVLLRLTIGSAYVMTFARRMAPVERSKFFQTRMSPDEIEMLNTLAEAEGLSASDVVRQLVRRAYLDRVGAKPPPKRKR